MPAIPKNTSQSFSVELRDLFGNLDSATTGAPTINLCKDGTWAVAANAPTNTKAGYWVVTLTQAETNYREIIVEAVKAGFVTWSRTFYPEPDYTAAKAAFLDEAISAAKTLTSGERTSIAAAVWNALTSGMATAGSIGKKLADWVVGAIDTYTGNTPQTGDAFARVGAAGAGLTALGDARLANLDAAVSTRSTLGGTAQTGDAFARLGAPAGASVSADVAAVKGDSAAVKAKTDNLPASPAAVGSAMTLTSGERDAIVAALLAVEIEDGVTLEEWFMANGAFAAGDGDGFDTGTKTFDAIGNPGTLRLTAVTTASGRSITLHLP